MTEFEGSTCLQRQVFKHTMRGSTCLQGQVSKHTMSLQAGWGPSCRKFGFLDMPKKKSETTEAIAEVQVLKQMAKSLDDSRESLFLSVWGFAGQEVFDVLHHVSLTRCGVYVHCFNLRSFEPEATDLEPEENKMKQ